jgi:plastocyanin
MTRILTVVAFASALLLAVLAAAVAPAPAAASSLSIRVSPDSVSPLETVTISGRVSPKLKKAARLTLQSSSDGATFITLKRLSLAKGATSYKTTWVAGATLGPLYVRARFGTLTTKKLLITVAERADVQIMGHAFSPKTLTVKQWTTVRWTNEDSSPHTVTAVDGLAIGSSPTGLFDGGPLANGAGFAYTFTTPGTYSYECKIHSLEPAMHAQVIVQ